MDISQFLKIAAPGISSAFLGPLGGVAASFIADKLGVQERTVEAVSAALSDGKLSAEQVGQIKLAEIEFQKFLKQNQIDLAKLDVDNTKSARDMQINTKAYTPAIMSYCITAGFFGILGYMMSNDYQASEPLLVMLGSLGTAWVAVVNFWFGSSHGSQVKSELLSRSEPPK